MLLKSSSTTTNPYDNSFISVFVLSGDFPQIGRSELLSILESNNIDYNIIDETSRIILVSFTRYNNSYDKMFQRIAYCTYFGILLFSYNFDSDNFYPNKQSFKYLKKFQTFSVRKINISNRLDNKYERILGSLIQNLFPHLNVNLSLPEVTLSVCQFNDQLLIFSNQSLYDEPRWLNRRPRARPFFLPFAIHPKLSRALINLCRLNPGQRLLDPFCGTGSIGIESCILDIDFTGIDISKKICYGAQRNLNYFNLDNFNIINADSLKLPISFVDGIVTDFPYGRSSIKKFSDTVKFMEEFFNLTSKLLTSGSYIVYMSPKDWPEYTSHNYCLVDKHELYIHSNLTRVIRVIRKL
tara:strand:- start:7361 stop:8419 length:1059 start_codon:yes stop_codon:yes gene_type:complete